MFRFIPREDNFFALFSQAAATIHQGASHLKAMVDDYARPHEQAAAIKEIEHAGDLITHEIMIKLNQTFITTLDREDIHALASAMDDVLDCIEEAADLMAIYKIDKPTPEAQRLCHLIVQATEEIAAGIHDLSQLQKVFPHCVEINRLENEADRISRDAIGQLFGSQQDPVTIMKWKEIYDTLEEATDRCEDVANVLEAIALKNA